MSDSSDTPELLPRGTVATPAVSIAVITLILAVGLESLGMIDRMDGTLLAWSAGAGLADLKLFSPWAGWGIAVAASFLPPAAILETPSHWRRIVLWISAVVLMMAMWPVLVLAGCWWPVTPAVVAACWSGFCGIVYAARHQMPCEGGNAGRRSQPVRNH